MVPRLGLAQLPQTLYSDPTSHSFSSDEALKDTSLVKSHTTPESNPNSRNGTQSCHTQLALPWAEVGAACLEAGDSWGRYIFPSKTHVATQGGKHTRRKAKISAFSQVSTNEQVMAAGLGIRKIYSIIRWSSTLAPSVQVRM